MAEVGIPPSDGIAAPCEAYISQPPIGLAIIICNINFSLVNAEGKQIKTEPRSEQEKDIPRLKEVLGQLGFKVETHKDLTTTQMLTVLETAATESDAFSCLLCVVSSHGNWYKFSDKAGKPYLGDYVFGTNGLLPLKVFTGCMQTEALKNKPKLFFFQACRGDGYMSNVTITETDGKVTSADEEHFTGSHVKHVAGAWGKKPEDLVTKLGITYDVPIKRDYFLHFATSPGYVSFPQGGVGTPFLQAWCDVLTQTTGSREIHDLATLVNAKVCEQYASSNIESAAAGGHHRKQAPQIVSMLTKDFFIPIANPTE